MVSVDFSTRDLGVHIKIARNNLNMKQCELASRVGTSTTHLSDIEHGHTKPSLALVVRIASELNVSLDELIGHSAQSTGGAQPLDAEFASLLEDCSTGEKTALKDLMENALCEMRAKHVNL